MRGCSSLRSALPQRYDGGFSIVELMVALVVGLVLMTGVVQVYVSNKQTSQMTESLSRMQENGRFTLDLLTREIRMAGFMPCRITTEVANVLNPTSGGPASSFGGAGVVGIEGSDASLPSFGTSAGDRVTDTDAFWLQGGGNRTFQVNNHQPAASSAAFFLNDVNTLEDGDVVLVCDTQQASVFQVTNTQSSNETVVHNTGGSVSPGNCVRELGYSSDPCTSPVGYTYGSDAVLVQFKSVAYYIGVSGDGSDTALYRQRLQNSGGSSSYVREELIRGVENMQLQYGLDTDADGQIEEYQDASSVSDWQEVRTVRMGLLIRSDDNVAQNADSRTYNLAGTAVGTSGAVTHPSDRRLRHAFNTTIQIRNRGL
ncbi:PilW family protein [Ectothiorhodospiraceae bacterium WFHF3C12]|nr:PilW family protein [Ectothiorhodospiraceae bacterium WFHF3C12]